MSRINVPVPRPYVGQHRAPEQSEPDPRPVGEGTRERRPYDLAEAEGPTRRIETTSGFLAAARAVWQVGRAAR